jgi:hypothetical protein
VGGQERLASENASISLLQSASFPGYQLPAKSDLLTAIRSTPSLFTVIHSRIEFLIAKISKVPEIRFLGLIGPDCWLLWKRGYLVTIQKFSKLSIRKIITPYQRGRSPIRG